MALDLVGSIGQPSFEQFKNITLAILTILVFIEIFTLLLNYVRKQRLRLTNIVDASLVVALRELWVQIHAVRGDWSLLLSLSAVLIALGLLRVVSVKYSVEDHDCDESRSDKHECARLEMRIGCCGYRAAYGGKSAERITGRDGEIPRCGGHASQRCRRHHLVVDSRRWHAAP